MVLTIIKYYILAVCCEQSVVLVYNFVVILLKYNPWKLLWNQSKCSIYYNYFIKLVFYKIIIVRIYLCFCADIKIIELLLGVTHCITVHQILFYNLYLICMYIYNIYLYTNILVICLASNNKNQIVRLIHEFVLIATIIRTLF